MSDVKPEEIREVLGYINQIKNYEVHTQAKIDASLTLVWGILLIMAGISDMFIQIAGNNMLGSLMWIVAAIGGIIYSKMILQYFGREYMTEEGKQSLENSKAGFRNIIWIMLISSLLGTLILINLVLNNIDLIIPGLTFLIGTVFLVLRLKNNYDLETNVPSYIMWTLPYAGALISIILYYTIGRSVVVFFGLIMGLTLGLINIIDFLIAIHNSSSQN